MKKIEILALCGIVSIVLSAYSVYDWFNTEDGVKIVDCYDKNGHKIIGVECEDDGIDKEDMIFVAVFTFIAGGAMIVGSQSLWNSGDYF